MNPSLSFVNQVGLHWISDDVFLCNSSIFSKLLDILVNSLNLNFRTHNFNDTSINQVSALQRQGLINSHNWKPHRHTEGIITRDCTEADAARVSYIELSQRRRIPIAALAQRPPPCQTQEVEPDTAHGDHQEGEEQVPDDFSSEDLPDWSDGQCVPEFDPSHSWC
jgi:hypothetical protein